MPKRLAPVVGPLGERLLDRRPGLAAERRGEVPAGPGGGRREAGEREQRRRQVERRGREVGGPRRQARRAEDPGHADRALVGHDLPVGALGADPALAHHEAVVAEEDDDRRLGEPGGVERAEHAADLLVERAHRLVVVAASRSSGCRAGSPAGEARRPSSRHRASRCAAGSARTACAARCRRARGGTGPLRAVSPRRKSTASSVSRLLGVALADGDFPRVPARQLRVLVEVAAPRHPGAHLGEAAPPGVGREMPLPHQHGRVAGGAEEPGERRRFGERVRPVSVGAPVLIRIGAVLVGGEARHQRRPARQALGDVDRGLAQVGPLRRQPIEHGVWIAGFPAAPSASQRWSSEVMKTTFGRSSAAQLASADSVSSSARAAQAQGLIGRFPPEP